jgi:hypothetical protein
MAPTCHFIMQPSGIALVVLLSALAMACARPPESEVEADNAAFSGSPDEPEAPARCREQLGWMDQNPSGDLQPSSLTLDIELGPNEAAQVSMLSGDKEATRPGTMRSPGGAAIRGTGISGFVAYPSAGASSAPKTFQVDLDIGSEKRARYNVTCFRLGTKSEGVRHTDVVTNVIGLAGEACDDPRGAKGEVEPYAQGNYTLTGPPVGLFCQSR